MDIITVLVGVATTYSTYKIKLIDDRGRDGLQKFKSYFVRAIMLDKNRTPQQIKDDSSEPESWLDKDIPYIIISKFKNKNDPALLDYYQDYKDNEIDRGEIVLSIGASIIYLCLYNFIDEQMLRRFLAVFILLVFFYLIFIKRPRVSIINNQLINHDNSNKAVVQLHRTIATLEEDFIKYKKKYAIN